MTGEVVRPVKAEQPSTQPPFTDPKTGKLTPYGHRLLQGLFLRSGGFNDDLAGLLIPSLLGEISALELQDVAARIEAVAANAVQTARSSLAEELERRIQALESPLSLPMSLAIARVAETQEALEELRLVLNGTTPFTALNIGGTNVAPFLGYTNGSRITDVAAVTQNLITPAFSALSNSAVTWGAEAAEKDLQSVSVTVTRGQVIITFVADIGNATSATGWSGRLRLYRGATEITEAVRFIRTLPPSGGNYELPSQMMLTYIDEPGAGTYTYKVTFATGDVVTVNVSNRSLICQVTEG